jgi:hypothetical protein
MALKTFANVRLRLGASGVQGEIYAKVTSASDANTYVLRFTSIDPVATRLIERALGG